MTSKATDKIIEALTELMEGFAELQEAAEKEFKTEGVELSEEADEEDSAEIDAAVVNEMRAALENVIENEDYSAEEFADVISALTDALEEIDPGVFVDNGLEQSLNHGCLDRSRFHLIWPGLSSECLSRAFDVEFNRPGIRGKEDRNDQVPASRERRHVTGLIQVTVP